jgi:cytochrome c peroxidase
VPDDNPMSPEKVELGRHLFYDPRLSGNGTQSCGSCHAQDKAFTDGRARAVGSTDELHPRGAMGIANVAWAASLGWANPTLVRLERQALVPMFGEHPVELGLAGREDELIARLRADDRYPALFAAAFPPVEDAAADDAEDDAEDAITLERVTKGLAAFERSVVSARAPYDRYVSRDDEDALNDAAKRGLRLFFSERLECYHCHGGFNFTDSVVTATSAAGRPFHNTGLYNTDGAGAYPDGSTGLLELTGDPADMGRFKAPTLRNIALTAPYMHDGSIATLDGVIDHYAAGGRTLTEAQAGDDAGVGSASPWKSTLVKGFTLTADERADLMAFLLALTDDELVTDPRYADPFSP